jgi:hypothetical protein
MTVWSQYWAERAQRSELVARHLAAAVEAALARPETYLPTAILRDLEEGLAEVRELDGRIAQALPAGPMAAL